MKTKTKTTHTKGPWNIWQEGGIHSNKYSIEGVGKFEIDNYSNAQLIASAPELLETLKKIHEELEDHVNPNCNNSDCPQCWSMGLASKAIDKATNEEIK